MRRERRFDALFNGVDAQPLWKKQRERDQYLREPDRRNRQDEARRAKETTNDECLDEYTEHDGGGETNDEAKEVVQLERRNDQQHCEAGGHRAEIALSEVDDPIGAIHECNTCRNQRDTGSNQCAVDDDAGGGGERLPQHGDREQRGAGREASPMVVRRCDPRDHVAHKSPEHPATRRTPAAPISSALASDGGVTFGMSSIASSPATSPRQSASERREQLLDAAADLLVERGLVGFNMESLAARAGVSKALPYRHFDNADDALVALYRREIDDLAVRIAAAVRSAEPGDAMVRAAVHAYFDAVAARGAVLALLAGAGSTVPDLADGGRQAPSGVADLLAVAYGLRGRRALVLASIVTAAVTAASDAWGRGDASRSVCERVAVDAVIGGIHAVVDGVA